MTRHLRRLSGKLVAFVGRRRAEEELNREIASHLALLQDEYLRRGMTPEEALLAAKRAYGGVEQAKELHRDERSLLWLEQAIQDLRHAWRSLSKSKAFVAVALLSLAFGIGANTAIFTLVNGVLLKHLSVVNPQRVVELGAHFDRFDTYSFSMPVFRELRRQNAIFQDAVAFSAASASLDLAGEAHKIDLELVTGSYFPFFGARAALGRLLDEEDDRVEGGQRVCVLSYYAWQTNFGGDPRIVTQTITVNRVPLQVVGVARADFTGGELQKRYDVWAPTALAPSLSHHARDTPNMVWLRALARIQPGLSLTEARARLMSASRPIEDALPKNRANANAVYVFRDASKGVDSWRSTLRDPLLILMSAVTLVLLLACANLANLLLARTNERHLEFAIKLSLGISRWRLLRQLLLETFLLTLGGGALAYFFSMALTRFLLDLFNQGNPFQPFYVAPDGFVLIFTLSACIVTALIAGMYPAWQASRSDSAPGLKGLLPHGVRRSIVRRSLIVVQVTLAVVLLFGASLFAHSLRQLKAINLGYDIDQLLSVEIGVHDVLSYLKKAAGPNPTLSEVLARVRQLPDVDSAAFSNPGVLSGGMLLDDITATETSSHINEVLFLNASSGYFSTMRIPLFRGHDFTAADRGGSPPVAIVNQRLASQISPNGDVVGMHFNGWGRKNVEIIGVAGNSKYQNVREETKPIVYMDIDQQQSAGAALEVRSRGPVNQVEREVREIVKSAAPGYEIFSASAMELMRDRWLSQDRLLTFLSTLFGTLGTALSLVGIYGLISYSVTRRTREIGIRVSVGAQRGDILRLFVREAMVLVAGGIALGLPLALLLATFLRKLLFEVSTSDPLGISTTLALLLLGGLLASLFPARRAARVNPVQAMRYE